MGCSSVIYFLLTSELDRPGRRTAKKRERKENTEKKKIKQHICGKRFIMGRLRGSFSVRDAPRTHILS